MIEIKAIFLFIITAIMEIVGCYLPYLWLKQDKSPWLLLPAGLALSVFVWLLTLHPTAAGRVYAAYGGVYIGVAILWLWVVDGIQPTAWDIVGCVVTLIGASIIIFAPKG
ncbi:MAG: YnfA family protein [Gammaproteobacteria bacterium]|nr:YnfA family protein [Gammaproteobacteria bacterium]